MWNLTVNILSKKISTVSNKAVTDVVIYSKLDSQPQRAKSQRQNIPCLSNLEFHVYVVMRLIFISTKPRLFMKTVISLKDRYAYWLENSEVIVSDQLKIMQIEKKLELRMVNVLFLTGNKEFKP